jgi:hypothetical protein
MFDKDNYIKSGIKSTGTIDLWVPEYAFVSKKQTEELATVRIAKANLCRLW